MFSDMKNSDFAITNLEIKGDSQINNIIKIRLNKYLKNNSDRKYKVNIKTSLDKLSAAKDATGKTTNLKLVIKLDLTFVEDNIDKTNTKKNILFSETITVKKNENNYEQNNYEKIVIQNISETLLKKMILYLAEVK
tara:strand:- start:1059 stop:1466 length:408 start_codon:yes stop_codon:yes gene_type:complete